MTDTMKIAVVVPAAGLGKRFAGGQIGSPSKVEMDLAGKPVFLRSLELFFNRPQVHQIILAVHPEQLDTFKLRWGDRLAFHGVQVVAGGTAERWETVLKSLAAVDEACTHVAIHDAARPLGSRKLIDRVFEAAGQHAAVIPGLPVSATLKRVRDVKSTSDMAADRLDTILGTAGKPAVTVQQVVATVDRTNLIEVQTPQVFQHSLLMQAYEPIATGKLDGAGITDDAGLIEQLGEPVYVVPGESTNLKITQPEDRPLATALARLHDEHHAAAIGRKRLFNDRDDDE